MSAGQRSNIIRFRLNGLLGSIWAELLKFSGKQTTPLPTDHAFVQLKEKISSWTEQLERLSRQMKGMQKSLDFQASRIRSSPREIRYSQYQSVHDRQKHVETAQNLLDNVAKELARLWSRLATPTDVDIINRIHKLLDTQLDHIQELRELEKMFTNIKSQEATTAIVEVRAQIMNPAHHAPPGGVDSIAMLILLLRLFQIFALSVTTKK